MGEAGVILGIRIKHENKGLTITQSHYIEKVFKKFNCEGCGQVNTSMEAGIKLMLHVGKPMNQLEYSRAIGFLMYAMTSTRPNIAFAVLEKTINYGLSYVGFPSVVEGYLDESWITNSEDHTSTTGWVFLLALAAAGKEAEWLRNLIYEIPLWPKPISPIFTHCDTEFNVESLQLNIGTHRIIPRYKTKGTTYVSTEFRRFKKLELGFYMLMKDMNTRLYYSVKCMYIRNL
ncbi:hypothetical protein Tco_0764016 [Tanacetum coccineum]